MSTSIIHTNSAVNQQENVVNQPSGSGQQQPLEKFFVFGDNDKTDALKNGGLLGGKAEKYIRDSANIEDLPGDDDDDLDEDDEDTIDLDEELEIETDVVEEGAVEIDEDDMDLVEDDDDELDDDDDIL